MERISKNVLVVHATVTADQFLRFSRFHALVPKHRGLGLLAFFSLLSLFGWCNLITGSPFLCWIFVCTGILVPGIYLINYHKSVRGQIKQLKLSEIPVKTYTVNLGQQGVCVDRDGERLFCDWKDVSGAHHMSGCTYLYYTPERALILPDGDIANANPGALWELLKKRMPEKSMKKWRIRL